MIICEVYYSCKVGMRSELLDAIRDNMYATRKEEGNISYTHYLSLENDTDLFVFEVWNTLEDVERHINAKHYLEFSRIRKPLLREGSYKFRVYDANVVRDGTSVGTW